jgi:hypothetical protein
MKRPGLSQLHARRGAVVVLTAILLVAILGMAAMSIDMGYVATVHSQLQRAADGAALAAAAEMNKNGLVAAANRAKQIAALNASSGGPINLADSNIEFGIWNLHAKTFTPTTGGGNAVRVRIQQSPGLFFARAMGIGSTNVSAEAIAIATPRDICFVVDLSGSMNDDTDPCWATNTINSTLGSTVGNSIMQDVYDDFNLGSFPGTNQHIGHPLGSAYRNLTGSASTNAYANMTANGGPLTSSSIPSAYRISSSDSETVRKQKAYRYIIDNQIAVLIPNAKPAPNSTTNYAFWERYLDYLIIRSSPSGRGTVPPNVDTSRTITNFNNPNTQNYPSATGPNSHRNYVGPRTYIQFLMDYGRDEKVAGAFTPLCASSSLCPWNDEMTEGGMFSFPPREQPTHACRRCMIAALSTIQQSNALNPSPDQRDWVSVVTFDKASPGPQVVQPLTSDYRAAMEACTKLQAVSDIGASTATESGLIKAQQVLEKTSLGGTGREFSDKIVVLLTDGQPNIVSSSSTVINNFRNSNPHSDWYGGSSYVYDGPLMQSMKMQAKGWKTYAVGIGFGTDYGFMDRLARTGATADADGRSPRNTGDPSQYEEKLKKIFEDVVANFGVRLVK